MNPASRIWAWAHLLCIIYVIIIAFTIGSCEILIILPILWIVSLPSLLGFYLLFEWLAGQTMDKTTALSLCIPAVVLITSLNSFALLCLIGFSFDKADTISDLCRDWLRIWPFTTPAIIAAAAGAAVMHKQIAALTEPVSPHSDSIIL